MSNLHLPDFSDADPLISRAFNEDAYSKDVTTAALIPKDWKAEASIYAKQNGVVCGLPVIERIADTVCKELTVACLQHDGDLVEPSCPLAEVRGPAALLLSFERTALNFLQRLSGIAALTHEFTRAVEGTGTKILDTRKTTPGWRNLEKYAVTCGGGVNHRFNLRDQALIKENHLYLLAKQYDLSIEQAIEHAVKALRKKAPDVPLEIEVENLSQLNAALQCRPDIILLDNMTPELIKQALAKVNEMQLQSSGADKPLIEVSGGISLDNVSDYANLGIDRISIGTLTHSAPSMDIAMEIKPSIPLAHPVIPSLLTPDLLCP